MILGTQRAIENTLSILLRGSNSNLSAQTVFLVDRRNNEDIVWRKTGAVAEAMLERLK